ncbi:MAG: small multi-drug export protein [Clostridiales bacterium]|nr:small multi-drug export protein [Clostridiales bacterium]
MDSVIQSILSFLEQYQFPPELAVFLVSLLPILELRGGLIAAYALGIDWIPAFFICFLANIIPVPFILFFGKKIIHWMKRTRIFRKLGHKLEKRTIKKSQSVQKYKLLGLFLFVAIPLPGTGAWTGSLVAAVMDMRMKHSVPVIAAGIVVAGFIMTLLTYGLLRSIGIG